MPDGAGEQPIARRVLITRPAGRATALAERLRRSGALVDERPTISFEPPNDVVPRDRAVARVAEFTWIVLSSPTAVGFFLSAIVDAGGTVPSGTRFAVVGPGTAAELERHGVRASVVARRADADGLARDLVPRVGPGDRVLVARPESGGREVVPEVLRSAGARVDAVAFYRTVASADAPSIARDLVERRYDVVVFTSPSTFRALLPGASADDTRVLEALRAVRRVAIGPVTSRAMTRSGVPADAVARQPTDEAIEAAVVSVW